MHRIEEQYLALFVEQAQSGLTQAEFSELQGIILRYFSYRKRQVAGVSGL